jgi:transposase-like protein
MPRTPSQKVPSPSGQARHSMNLRNSSVPGFLIRGSQQLKHTSRSLNTLATLHLYPRSMNDLAAAESPLARERKIHCPACHTTTTRKFGRAWTGKQRYLCLSCGRQFTPGSTRREIRLKPNCPKCGKHMNVYKREKQSVRFRCSEYPGCRTYHKLF